MARADLVIANSAYTRAHALAQHAVARSRQGDRHPARPGPRSGSIPGGCQRRAPRGRLRARLGPATDDGRVRLLLAGRLTRWKGQALAIEVAAGTG